MTTKLELSINEPDWRKEWRELDEEMSTKVTSLLKITGIEAVAFLRSLTDTMRPPVRASEGWRKAHPGGWADVTSQLALGYDFEVLVARATYDAPPAWWSLVLMNHVEYAVYLENLDGYYVLAGITDPGAPLERMLRDAARDLGFDVRIIGG